MNIILDILSVVSALVAAICVLGFVLSYVILCASVSDIHDKLFEQDEEQEKEKEP